MCHRSSLEIRLAFKQASIQANVLTSYIKGEVKGLSEVTNNIFKTKCFRLWVGGFDGVSF